MILSEWGESVSDVSIDYDVHEAAAALDILYPNWHNRIDADTLDIMSCNDCIIGQTVGRTGSFMSVLEELHDYIFPNTPYSYMKTTDVFTDDSDKNTNNWLHEIAFRKERDGLTERELEIKRSFSQATKVPEMTQPHDNESTNPNHPDYSTVTIDCEC